MRGLDASGTEVPARVRRDRGPRSAQRRRAIRTARTTSRRDGQAAGDEATEAAGARARHSLPRVARGATIAKLRPPKRPAPLRDAPPGIPGPRDEPESPASGSRPRACLLRSAPDCAIRRFRHDARAPFDRKGDRSQGASWGGWGVEADRGFPPTWRAPRPPQPEGPSRPTGCCLPGRPCVGSSVLAGRHGLPSSSEPLGPLRRHLYRWGLPGATLDQDEHGPGSGRPSRPRRLRRRG
jgi:hypothetical protein